MLIEEVTDISMLAAMDFGKFAANCITESHFGEAGIVFDPKSVKDFLVSYVLADNKVIYIAIDNDTIFGILMGEVNCFNFSSTKIAEITYSKIDKGYQKRGVYSEMYKHFYGWSKERKCAIIISGIHEHNNDNPEDVEEMLKHMNFKKFHTNYYIEV